MDNSGNREGLLSKCLVYLNHAKDVFNLVTHTYQVIPATNPTLAAESYKVRHKVYCAELNYEASNSSGIETDEFDHHSTQMVVYSRPAKSCIGCVRLVHGHHEGKERDLPFEHHCKGKLDTRLISMVKESGHKYAEVSRLAIDRDYRHIGRKKALKGHKKSSFVLLSLYLGLQALARQQNVRYLFAIVEPRLLKNLHRHNVAAIQIGQGIDHRGLRVPILIDVEDIERVIPSAIRPIYNLIRRDVGKVMGPETVDTTEIAPLPLHDIMREQKDFAAAN